MLYGASVAERFWEAVKLRRRDTSETVLPKTVEKSVPYESGAYWTQKACPPMLLEKSDVEPSNKRTYVDVPGTRTSVGFWSGGTMELPFPLWSLSSSMYAVPAPIQAASVVPFSSCSAPAPEGS
jgi:hypothetical protein